MKQKGITPRVIIIGCGYVGQRLAARWQQRQAQVIATSRQALPNQPCTSYVRLDLDQPGEIGGGLDWQDAIVYYCVPPAEQSDHHDPRLQRLLKLINDSGQRPRGVIYFSTTAVYGDCQGEWVTEDSVLQPHSARGRRRLAAEQCWRDWHEANAVPLTILRVAGIYGPGRVPIAALQAGQVVLDSIYSPYSNRIHVNDLTEVCLAAADQQSAACQIYNVSDGQPTTMSDYYFAVAKQFGLPRPATVDWQQAEQLLSERRLEFLRESKRVANAKLINQLGVRFQYADVVYGVKQCYQEMTS